MPQPLPNATRRPDIAMNTLLQNPPRKLAMIEPIGVGDITFHRIVEQEAPMFAGVRLLPVAD